MAIDPLSLVSTIGSGILGSMGASKIADANKAANDATIAAARENQERGLKALTGGSAFQNVKMTPDGGYNIDQPGAADAAATRSILAFGDQARARETNKATDFNFKLPTVGMAEELVERDIGRKQGAFDTGLNTIIEDKRRKFGGINNTGEAPSTIKAIADFTNENQFNKEQQALSLFDKSMSNDIANKQALLNTLKSQAGAPQFQAGGPGTQAAQLIAQTPMPATIGDVGDASGFLGGQSILASIRDQNNVAMKQEQDRNLIDRWLGNS